jgi:UrcA family protein
MILFGIVGAAGMAAASAATQEFERHRAASSSTTRHSLLTDTGAHAVYRKIVTAAEQVCPASSGSLLW